ncbi:hypothetical protein HK405_007976 [Cladochytrium tenue]|nr:hypothetical protein HK405_007976 [Cladochytrium tenue]
MVQADTQANESPAGEDATTAVADTTTVSRSAASLNSSIAAALHSLRLVLAADAERDIHIQAISGAGGADEDSLRRGDLQRNQRQSPIVDLCRRAESGVYKDLAHFQVDMQELLQNACRALSGNERDAREATASLVYKSLLSLVDQLQKQGFPLHAQDEGAVAHPRRPASAEPAAAIGAGPEHVALARKGDDGLFYFTSSSSAHLVDAQLDPAASNDFMKVVVGATPSLEPVHVRKLGDFDAVDTARRVRSRRRDFKRTPLARATPYHPLASFAPTHDVADAATSHVELSGVLAAAALDEAADLLAVLQGPPAPAVAGLAMPSSTEQAEARAVLGKAEDLDFDAVLEGYHRTLSGRDSVAVTGAGAAAATTSVKASTPAAVCKENGVLLELLSVLQEERYKGAIDRPLIEEAAIASIVADNLAVLLQEPGVGQGGPSHLPASQAMAALQLGEAGYKGTLPMNKPYAFKLNTAARR